jgi:hypothetical protein
VFSKLWWSSGTIQVVERLSGGVMGVELTFLRCFFFIFLLFRDLVGVIYIYRHI